MNQSFSEWILVNAKKLSLEIEDLQWIKRAFIGLHDIHASVVIGGKRSEGRGTAESKDLAIIKAVAEAIERAVCLQFLSTTNGVAAHGNLEEARKNAQNEILERDLFLSHFLTKTPFSFSKEWTSQLPCEIGEYIHRAGDSIQIFKMKPTSHGCGFVCLIRGGSRWGGILGLSFGQNDERSLVIKAALEACRHYWHRRARGGLTEDHSLESFLALTDWKYVDNGRLGLNRDYFGNIAYLFPENVDGKISKELVDYRSVEFSFQALPMNLPELTDCPLKVVHCFSDYIQQLLPGPFDINEIYQPGLMRFTGGRDFTLASLPHPID